MSDNPEAVDYFKNNPKKKLSEIDKQIVFILIEKSKIQRERAHATINKAFFLFCILIVLAFLGKFNYSIPNAALNVTFLLGILVLVAITGYYEKTMRKEEKNLDQILESFMR